MISNLFAFAEIEGQSMQIKNLLWGPLYCVLQQDEQAFTAYCSEELSVSLICRFCYTHELYYS